MRRNLGQASGISVGAAGAGCWAIGGPWQFDGRPAGWGAVDDDESIRAIRRGLELGITLFDTADVYGCGHSERVLGRAIAGHRDEVVLSTKFGLQFDEATRTGAGADASPESVRRACEASLHRLGTDRIDLYQLHAGADGRAEAAAVVEVLEELVAEGKIRFYGTADETLEVVETFAEGSHCVAVQQQQLNVFGGNDEAIEVCEARGLAALARSPLAMGLLTREVPAGRRDARRGRRPARHAALGLLRRRRLPDLVGTGRRDPRRADERRAHARAGCAGVDLGADPVAIPIPGFRTVAQIEENAGARPPGRSRRTRWRPSTRRSGADPSLRGAERRPGCQRGGPAATVVTGMT